MNTTKKKLLRKKNALKDAKLKRKKNDTKSAN